MVYKRKNNNKNDSLIIDEERKSNSNINDSYLIDRSDYDSLNVLLSMPNLNDNNNDDNKNNDNNDDNNDDNKNDDAESKLTEKKALQDCQSIHEKSNFTFFDFIITFSSSILNFLYNFIKSIFKIIYKIICSFFKISCMYFVWIIMHYFASHLYTKLCVPNNFYGFLVSPFLTSTPHCQGLRWIVYNAANTINTMWILIGTWLCSKIMFYSPNENINSNSNSPSVSEGFNNMNFYYGGTGI